MLQKERKLSLVVGSSYDEHPLFLRPVIQFTMPYFCSSCNKKFSSRQSLWNHKQRHELANKVIGGSKKDGAPSKQVLNKLLKPKSLNQLTQESKNPKLKKGSYKNKNGVLKNTDDSSIESESDSDSDTFVFLPDNKNDLVEKFNNLYANFNGDGDIETYNQLISILDELKRMKLLDEYEYDAWNQILQQNIGIEGRIKETTKNLLDNDKKQILHSLNLNDETEQKIYNLISEFEDQDVMKEIFQLLPLIKSKLLQCKLEILLNEMRKKQHGVIQIFSRLDTDEYDKEDALKSLKQDRFITDEQYKKLFIAPHNFDAYSKVIEGRGLWLNKV